MSFRLVPLSLWSSLHVQGEVNILSMHVLHVKAVKHHGYCHGKKSRYSMLHFPKTYEWKIFLDIIYYYLFFCEIKRKASAGVS